MKEHHRAFLEALMGYERQCFLNARPYERTDQRVDQANGFYGRQLTTRLGVLDLRVPRTRHVRRPVHRSLGEVGSLLRGPPPRSAGLRPGITLQPLAFLVHQPVHRSFSEVGSLGDGGTFVFWPSYGLPPPSHL
jgi:transposase InsO family protein